jgi:hypothetical protein
VPRDLFVKPNASWFVTAGFVVLPAGMALLLVVLLSGAARRLNEADEARRKLVTRTATAVGVWMATVAMLAEHGTFARFELRPPPFLLLIVACVGAGLLLGLTGVGRRLSQGLPLAVLVGVQSFRLLVELLMHEAAREGVMPAQMSFAGRNFDILTGLSALAVASLVHRGLAGQRVVLVWNVAGAGLLVNAVTTALLSSPMVHWFGTAPEQVNTFVAYFPFVWLPSVLVVSAIVWHIVVFRALYGEGGEPGRR